MPVLQKLAQARTDEELVQILPQLAYTSMLRHPWLQLALLSSRGAKLPKILEPSKVSSAFVCTSWNLQNVFYRLKRLKVLQHFSTSSSNVDRLFMHDVSNLHHLDHLHHLTATFVGQLNHEDIPRVFLEHKVAYNLKTRTFSRGVQP